ncbi:MAG: N-acetyl-D-myo-inositol-2-amino-2-deoxy-alpha-D-glucopyranoside deacetylase [Pseudonocardiales bacterium]|nr:N-acetyl-D-myo-inositol-2-amino-2-deoxy-alpha-D-glucopyranoside deacetylase [Pseudonocardiales bacterium]MDT7645520.1 N-acetyl-D-myo-inositol-2-amino-2-deoxy-alpha-D-glucopyranoside deacetylase [Pseudonocardiales bacterium]MDT7671736.1 N-acetyl-D-myo-inositol-2-amino-2-deoxy-alpha-D-glucopyranoside deacetylase [Pseudonocardiales bacterium]
MSRPRTLARRRLLLVHAHPDDESITTGGTIARYAAAPDTEVTLVTCTLGEQGEVMVPELAGLAAEHADQLGGYRIAELAAASAALGLTDHRFLGGVGRWRDSGMVVVAGAFAAAPPPESLHPRAFCADGQRAEQVAALAEILAEVQPQVVVGYDPGGSYGHPDHVRAHEITMAAAAAAPSVRKVYWTVQPLGDLAAGLAELAGAPARGMPWRLPGADELPSVPDETVTTRVEVTDQLAAKVAALRAHATQLTVWSRPSAPEGAGPTGIEQLAFALTNEIAMPVLRTESYTLAGAAGSVQPVRETDLFDGIEAW